MESWRIFYVAKKKLSAGALQKIFTRSCRLVDYWAANPRYCDETKRNPLDRIRLLIQELDLAGYDDYARAAIDYLAEPLGGRFIDNNLSRSDKGTVDGEMADISIALGDLGSRIREALTDGCIDTAEQIAIKKTARDIKREVEQLLDAAGVE